MFFYLLPPTFCPTSLSPLAGADAHPDSLYVYHVLGTVNNKILFPTWADKTQCLAPFVFTTAYSETLFQHTPLKATAPTTLNPVEPFPKLWCMNNLQQNPLGRVGSKCKFLGQALWGQEAKNLHFNKLLWNIYMQDSLITLLQSLSLLRFRKTFWLLQHICPISLPAALRNAQDTAGKLARLCLGASAVSPSLLHS